MTAEKKKIIVVFAIILAVVVLLAVTNLRESLRYSMSVSELLKKKAVPLAQNIRVKGKLVDNSIFKGRSEKGFFYEFKINDTGSVLKVHYAEPLPTTLVKGVTAIAEGHLRKDRVFQATRVFTVCPSKYDRKKMAKTYRAPHQKKPAKGLPKTITKRPSLEKT